MKKKIVLLSLIIFMFAATLFGCGTIFLPGGPAVTETVYGNGGSAVVKGNYLYFANAYIDYTLLGEGDNPYDVKKNQQNQYAIYRTKLNENGMVEVDENGTPKGAQLLVPQIGGYEKSGLYICGNYLFYTTPFTTYPKGSATEKKGLLRFERVNLDGSNHTKLSEGEYTVDCSYSVNYVNGTTYVTIKDGATINVIMSKANGDTKKYQLATGVEEYAVANQNILVYGEAENNFNKNVYYTKKNADDSYSLYKKSFTEGAEEINLLTSASKIQLVKVKNNRLYYKNNDYLFSSSFAAEEQPKQYSSSQFLNDATTEFVDFEILEDGRGYAVDRGIVANYYDGLKYSLVLFSNTSSVLMDSNTQFDILFTSGNEVYYQLKEDKTLYALNITSKTSRKVISSFTASANSKISSGENPEEEKTVTTFDFDYERIFYFDKLNEEGTISYLHMALLNGNTIVSEDDVPTGKLVGKE